MENVAKLNEAFHSFTQASRSLERYYRELRERVQYLTLELERKNSELEAAISEVREAKDYLQAVLQSISEAIIVLDQDEKVTMLNRAAEELLCSHGEALIGRPFNELGICIGGEGPETTLEVKGKRYEIILSRSTVSDPKGLLRGHVILIKDITRLKELEQHQERNQRLISMGEMAAKIVHEIRSPLCSIELFSNMLSKDLEGTEHAEIARGISTGIRSLNNVLTNMLFFAKPQKPSFRDVMVDSIIEDSLRMLTPLMEIRGIRLHKDITSHTIRGDQELLKQVFMNILLNAVQAMPQGGTLAVTTILTDGFITVEISDEGEGIAPENIEKVFDPFFSTKEKGTGLGLTIAHGIMQAHGGFIKARNNDGRGSTFCLYFPLKTNSLGRGDHKRRLNGDNSDH